MEPARCAREPATVRYKKILIHRRHTLSSHLQHRSVRTPTHGMDATNPAITLLILHAAATGFMVGLIWFVQIVHYPLFSAVGDEQFPRYAIAHQTRTTFVVMPPMLVELITAALLLTVDVVPPNLALLGLGLLIAVWISTFAVQVPCHARLARGFHAPAHRALVATNWARTILWTARLPLALWVLTLPAA